MSAIGSRMVRFRGWRLVRVAALAVLGAGAAAQAATNAPPAPSETPIAVVMDADSVQAAFDKARASGLGLVADLTLGHEGQLVRAKTAEPLAPGRYRMHALVACVAPDENAYKQLVGNAVALHWVTGGSGDVPLPSRAPKTESGGLRLVGGGSQGVVYPKPWDSKQEPAAVHFDFMVDKTGPIPVAVDWFVKDVSVNHEIRPAKNYELAARQKAIDKMNTPAGPDLGAPAAAADGGKVGAVQDELDAGGSKAKETPRLAPRTLNGKDLPPCRLVLAALVLERLSPVVKVSIEGCECFTYHTPIASFAGFDLAQAGKVEIECARTVRSVDVRPKSLGIRPEINGNKITLPLQAPAYLSVEINGDPGAALFLFADPPETDTPKPDSPGVKFFAAGKIHEAGTIAVKSGETVYIERGAVVRGSISIDDAKNVKILGRGILDLDFGGARPIEISRAEDVLVEGVAIIRPGLTSYWSDVRHWTMPILRSDRVTVRRVKIVSDNPWDDGVVVVGSRDVGVEKCFIRTQDSCVAVKAGGVTYFTRLDCQRDAENVTVRDCVLWNAGRGSGLEISALGWLQEWIGVTYRAGVPVNKQLGKAAGFKPRASHIRKVCFANSDLIHSQAPEGFVAIRNRDQATVSDVIYEDLRVEDAAGAPVVLRIRPSPFNPDTERGHIRDIVFRNIRVEGKEIAPSELSGSDEAHRIEGVVFDNVQVGGRKWTKLEDGPIRVEFATGVEFR